MNKRLRKHIFTAVKLLVMTALLVWVFSKAHWSDYVQVSPEGGKDTWVVVKVDGGSVECSRGWFSSAEHRTFEKSQLVTPAGSDNPVRPGLKTIITERMKFGPLVLAVLLTFIGLMLISVRWWWLMKMQDMGIGFRETTRLMFMGLFFNNIIPGSIGGDIVKAWYLSRQTHKTAVGLVTIFIDRAMGMSAMAILAVIMIISVLAVGVARPEQVHSAMAAVIIVLCGMFFLAGVIFSPRLRKMLNLKRLYEKLPIAHHITAAGGALEAFRKRPLELLCVMIIAVAVHCCVFGAIAILGVSLGINIPVYRYFVYLPIIYIIAAVPVTPGGVGLIETMYVEFLGGPGCDASAILVLAMLARFIPLALSMIGLPAALSGPKLSQVDKLEAELELAERKES